MKTLQAFATYDHSGTWCHVGPVEDSAGLGQALAFMLHELAENEVGVPEDDWDRVTIKLRMMAQQEVDAMPEFPGW